MKKVMCLLATAVLLMAAAPLSAQEDVAVKKVIPDALTAFASFDFTTMWSFWCEDGFIEKGGAKRTIPDLKKDDKYLKILDLSKMRQAKSLDELVDLMVQSGDMTAEQKAMIQALSDEQKKQAFNAMQQAVKMQEAMAKMAIPLWRRSLWIAPSVAAAMRSSLSKKSRAHGRSIPCRKNRFRHSRRSNAP